MRASRLPNNPRYKVAGHVLISSRPGRNRFQPGKYVCSCGTVCTGTNAFEEHRAAARKAKRNDGD